MRLFSRFFLASTLLLSLVQFSFAANAIEDETTLPSATVEVTQNDLTVTHLKISVPSIGRLESSAADGRSIDRFGLDLEPATTRPGWPELPMISRLVLVPPTGGIEMVIKDITSYVSSDYRPYIVPEQDGSENLDQSGAPADEYLSSDGFWPPNPIEIGNPAILRGNRMVSVIVYPMQVNRATGEVRYNTNVDFDLRYSNDGVNEIINPLRPKPSSTINRLIESLVVNPPSPSRDDPQRGSYLLVYYNANGIANALAPLITWRKRMGWDVQTMAIQVNASTDAIKGQIQRAYNEWDLPPEMIALVGDPDWGGNGLPAFPADAGGATDLDYALLEGGDILADADYGRITCRSVQELNQVVAKIVNYESNPYMDNTDWYRQGAVCAGYAGSGISTIFVNKWVRRQTLDRGWDNVHEQYFNAPFQGQNVPQFFTSEFARGINYATYRGWIGMEGLSADMIMGFQAHRRYPFATTLTCASGQYINQFCQTEGFFISAGGAIGSIGFATSSTHVPYNNAVFTGLWHGLLKLGLYNLGSSSNYGRYNLYRQYNGFENVNVTNFSKWANLMGDPATDMFTAIPQIVACEHDQSVALGTTRITIAVMDRDENTGVADAQVCLYKAADEFQMVVHTDENGIAEFAIPSDALTAGSLLVTATKHNMKPYLGTITVRQVEQFIGAEIWSIEQDNNNDGNANPGEDISLDVIVKNFGTGEPQGGITVTFESLSPWAEVSGDTINLQNAPEHDQSITIGLDLRIDNSAPNETAIPIGVNVQSGETTWRSMAAIQVLSPAIQIGGAFIANNRIEPGTQADIDFNFANGGGAGIEPFTAILWSEAEVVTVLNDQAAYPAIAVGRSSRLQGNPFRIRAHPFAVPGMKVTLKLAIATESGFRDTTTYVLTVGAATVTDPFGPDKYGYVCFDSGDRDWEMAPVYDWIEIDPTVQNSDFDGTLLNLQDRSEDADQSRVVDLPFEFQYYGQMFNRGTICTNGWFAFGNWAELADFRNRRINTGEGPDGQLCVLWDDLRTGRILTYHDEENGRFIVEWNGMTTQSDGHTETFELVLFDTDAVPTYSGDGVILFQYKDVSNSNGEGESHDTPYVTIGINSPTDLDGLEYTYYNTYSAGAKHIENGLAIKFTTAIQYITGVLALQVTDAATGVPVEGAQINTARGFWGECDIDGIAYINDILIGDYERLTASAQGYNDSTWVGDNGEGFTIVEAETLWVVLTLLHPEFTTDTEGFEFTMLPDSSTQTGFMLSNTGNGTLTFTSRFTYVIEDTLENVQIENPGHKRLPTRDDQDEQWDRLLSWNASEAVDNPRLQGIAFVNDHWVVCGGSSNRDDTLNYFYEFSRSGEYSGIRIPQETNGLYGYSDMEYFNGLLYCTFYPTSKIVAIDPTDYHIVSEWSLPRGFSNARNIAINPNTGNIWASGPTTRLYELAIENDTALVEVRNFQTRYPGTQDEIHEYGLSWFRDDPDGFCLYMNSNDESGVIPNAPQDNQHANVALFKMNTNTGEIRYLTDFVDLPPATVARCGIMITPKWNNLVWSLAMVFDHPDGDIVSIFELAPNSSWIGYNPRSDTLLASEFTPIDLAIESTDLDTGRYSVIIEFSHNAGIGTTRIPVTLDVVSVLPDVSISDDTATPFEYYLAPNFPNPFNAVTMIDYTLKEKGKVKLELFDLQGRNIRTLIAGNQTAGQHRISIDGSELSTGLYFYRLEAGEFKATRKMILVK